MLRSNVGTLAVRLRRTAGLAILATTLPAMPAGAQRGFRGVAPDPVIQVVPYDGRFTFARLKFTTGPGGFYYMGLPAWAHGYPKAENNLVRITREITTAKFNVDAVNVLALDDPQLMKYPVSFMVEPDYWQMNDKEAAGLRAYFAKGGFVIFDDFRDDFRNGNAGWANFEAQMKRVIPNPQFFDLQPTHPIFHSFFEINSFSIIPQAYGGGRPVFKAVFENNDPSRRMLAMINFNTDVSNFWEFSATGMYLVSDSNEGYKLGVNYLVYALTH